MGMKLFCTVPKYKCLKLSHEIAIEDGLRTFLKMVEIVIVFLKHL
jgi:hypothetical protein